MRQVAWNAAIDYQGLWKSAALPLLAGVRRRIGFSSRTVREFGVPMLYTDRVGTSSRHVADQNGELSERAGSKRATAPVNLCIPEPEKASLSSWLQAHGIDRYIVLSPGGGWRSKCWPAARFGSLSHKLRATLSLRCVVNIGPGEEDLATALVAASGDSQPLIYRGNLGQLMALVRGATCIVGGDTGPLHLGVALGAPVVAIFGPTDPARNGPYRGLDNLPVFHDVVLRAPGAHTSHKRHTEPDPAILAIDVDTVFAAVRRVAGAAT
jgi:ADP-heptose:LPS heptosyltransferase